MIRKLQVRWYKLVIRNDAEIQDITKKLIDILDRCNVTFYDITNIKGNSVSRQRLLQLMNKSEVEKDVIDLMLRDIAVGFVSLYQVKFVPVDTLLIDID